MKNISALLGLTQEELASILGVSRGLLSMYEIGKRNLPLEAKNKLSVLLQKQKELQANEKQIFETINNLEKIAVLNDLLFLNLKKQQQLQKKVEGLKQNIAKNLARATMITHLSITKTNKVTQNKKMDSTTLFKLETQQILLKKEINWLKKELKNLNKT